MHLKHITAIACGARRYVTLHTLSERIADEVWITPALTLTAQERALLETDCAALPDCGEGTHCVSFQIQPDSFHRRISDCSPGWAAHPFPIFEEVPAVEPDFFTVAAGSLIAMGFTLREALLPLFDTAQADGNPAQVRDLSPVFSRAWRDLTNDTPAIFRTKGLSLAFTAPFSCVFPSSSERGDATPLEDACLLVPVTGYSEAWEEFCRKKRAERIVALSSDQRALCTPGISRAYVTAPTEETMQKILSFERHAVPCFSFWKNRE